MIHSALMRPSATARNRSTAFSPGLAAMRGDRQKRCTRSRCVGFSISICAASMLARPPTSRPPMALGWPVTENGPTPGLPMRPVARWQLMMAFDLVGARRGLVDALAEHGHDRSVAANSR